MKTLWALAALLALASLGSAHAGGFGTLYMFHGNGDSAFPSGNVIKDAAGNLYGTTHYGGNSNCANGCGTVFKLAPDGTETVLYAFTGGADGAAPSAHLSWGAKGTLFGTTQSGGYTGPNCTFGGSGCGTIWKLTSNGALGVLHSFEQDDANDGEYAVDGLLKGAGGYRYGTTGFGGAFCHGNFGCGTIYKVSKAGVETVLYSFQGADGANPFAVPVIDSSGNLYGTTYAGGLNLACADDGLIGCGVIYRLAPDGTETVLYTFTGGSDGARPQGPLVRDAAGNLYGTTYKGGTRCVQALVGCGTVFKLAADGTFTVLHTFTGGADGAMPMGGLTMDKKGHLYGTAQNGGNMVQFAFGYGVVFEVNQNGIFSVLHAFNGGTDGAFPAGSLLTGTGGFYYGTTPNGGDSSCASTIAIPGCGTVFKVQQFP